MTRIERLRSSREFQRVFRDGRRASTSVLTCVAAGGGSGRVGVAAPRAIGGAVVRNRAKRLLREAARAADLRSDHDVVLVARLGIIRKSFQEVEVDVKRTLGRVGASC